MKKSKLLIAQSFYRCARYYRLAGVGSSTTVRKCQDNGQWTTRRSNFVCSLECGIGGSDTAGLVTGGVRIYQQVLVFQ